MHWWHLTWGSGRAKSKPPPCGPLEIPPRSSPLHRHHWRRCWCCHRAPLFAWGWWRGWGRPPWGRGRGLGRQRWGAVRGGLIGWGTSGGGTASGPRNLREHGHKQSLKATFAFLVITFSNNNYFLGITFSNNNYFLGITFSNNNYFLGITFSNNNYFLGITFSSNNNFNFLEIKMN